MAKNLEDAFPYSSYNVTYSSLTRLNTLDVHLPKQHDLPTSKPKYWLVFLHGGAWRDPKKTSRTILPTLPHLSDQVYRIAGVASLNYRLSPHPHHPTDPSSADDLARNALHSQHVEDVMTALLWLQKTYSIGERYVLVGHSAGATLALQTVMGTWKPPEFPQSDARALALPEAIVGLEGIYDLDALVESFKTVPMYRQFLEAAFGVQSAAWRTASPTSGKFSSSWPNARVVVLGHSLDDELVDFLQVEKMSEKLWAEKRAGRRDVVLSLKGKHDEVLDNGVETARAISTALQMLESAK